MFKGQVNVRRNCKCRRNVPPPAGGTRRTSIRGIRGGRFRFEVGQARARKAYLDNLPISIGSPLGGEPE